MSNNQDKSSHGGPRRGAGRKPGSATAKTRLIADRAAEQGITPLEFMLNVMRQEPPETEDERVRQSYVAMRFEAAKAAAPYIHPRLAAIEHFGPNGGPIEMTTKDQRDAAVSAALRADT